MLVYKTWLGREDSNLRMQEPKSCVLPLDDAPKNASSPINQDFRTTFEKPDFSNSALICKGLV